ncbi:fatty acyl-AMP ligase [Nocardia sp. NPDC057272]|uniref:fatty acyl-AMP ligase n=1 Tax=Nocardia sp. NPDC057272 TaxID=3346079 RepID=UPI00362D8AE9
MSTFTSEMFKITSTTGKSLTCGEPVSPISTPWTEINHHAACVAGSLSNSGIEPGSHVAVLSDNPQDVAVLVQAVWMRAASLTMLHQPIPRTDRRQWVVETLTTLRMIDASVVIVSESYYDVVPELLKHEIIVFKISSLYGGPPVAPINTEEDATALLQLTSGSTGSAKAVVVSFSSLEHNCQAMLGKTAKVSRDVDVMVSWLPLSHDMGFLGWLVYPMRFGLETVCTTPNSFVRSPILWAELISKYRGTITAAPNFAYSLLARRLRLAPDNSLDLSTLRWGVNGAEPIDPASLAKFLEAGKRFGLSEDAVVPAYGMAEATLAVSFSSGKFKTDIVDANSLEVHRVAQAPATSERETRTLVKLGNPIPGIEVQVVNESRDPLAARRVGELELRGESITEAFVTCAGRLRATSQDGWLPTGDLGYLTEEGEVVVCGRIKDIIIVAGRNIMPTEIERAAGRVEGVRSGNAVAVGIPSLGGREAFAVVVESDLHDNPDCRLRIARQVAEGVHAAVGVSPRFVDVVARGAIPKTPSGKHRRSIIAGDLANRAAITES